MKNRFPEMRTPQGQKFAEECGEISKLMRINIDILKSEITQFVNEECQRIKDMFEKGNKMPCMCWYDPSEEDKKEVKRLCIELVAILHRVREVGDPIGLEIQDIHKLIDHLYDPSNCKERELK